MIRTLISDQGLSMVSCFKEKFPDNNIQTCILHLSMKVPKELKSDFWRCAYAQTPKQFDSGWSLMKGKNKKFIEEKLYNFKQQMQLFSVNIRQGFISSFYWNLLIRG